MCVRCHKFCVISIILYFVVVGNKRVQRGQSLLPLYKMCVIRKLCMMLATLTDYRRITHFRVAHKGAS